MRRALALFLPMLVLLSGGAFPSPARSAVADPVDGFRLFAWVSPPVESTTSVRLAEMAEAGLNLAMPAWADSGRREDNLERLDFAAAHGIQCLIWDRRFERFLTLDLHSPEGGALLDSIVADYSSHPGFFGYYLGDEPPTAQFWFLSELFVALRARDPVHPAWNNLLGPSSFATLSDWELDVMQYLDRVVPAVLSDDQYDFLLSGDRHLFLPSLVRLRALSDARGIPFWAVVLMIAHGPYRALTEGELRWQVSMALAYGARGVGYFTWWTPAPDPVWNWQEGAIGYDGVPTHWFDTLVRFNPAVRAAGEKLAQLSWRSTTHAGGAPDGTVAFTPDVALAAVGGRAAIGEFEGEGATWLLVSNSDSLAARSITLTLGTARAVSRLEDGVWLSVTPLTTVAGPQLTLDLAAGDFTLLRLDPFAALDRGPGPALLVAPEPASGEVRLVVARAGAVARVAIADLGGRRVWSREVSGNGATLVWRGERESGGVAPAGLYFVRVTGPNGSVVRRLHWLGAP
jgi:hypothetical protein